MTTVVLVTSFSAQLVTTSAYTVTESVHGALLTASMTIHTVDIFPYFAGHYFRGRLFLLGVSTLDVFSNVPTGRFYHGLIYPGRFSMDVFDVFAIS